MKNQTLLLLFLFFFSTAQAQSYCDFQKLINDGKAMARKENYEMAMYKFNSARRCDPTKGEVVDKEVEKLFKAINRKKKQAEDEKRRADEERDKAVKAQEEADAARVRSDSLYAITELARAEADSTANLFKKAYNIILQQQKLDSLMKDERNLLLKRDSLLGTEVERVRQQLISERIRSDMSKSKPNLPEIEEKKVSKRKIWVILLTSFTAFFAGIAIGTTL